MLPATGPEVRAAAILRSTANPNRCVCCARCTPGCSATQATTCPQHVSSRSHRPATDFRCEHAAGRCAPGKVVLAAGNGNQGWPPWWAWRPRCVRSAARSSCTERARRILHYPVSTVRQTDEGTVMIGDSRRRPDSTTQVGAGCSPGIIADRAVRMFPLLRAVQRGADLGGAAGDVAGRFPDIRPIHHVSRRLHGHLPQRRDAGREPRARLAPMFADGMLRRSGGVSRAEVRCSGDRLKPSAEDASRGGRSTASPRASAPATASRRPCSPAAARRAARTGLRRAARP